MRIVGGASWYNLEVRNGIAALAAGLCAIPSAQAVPANTQDVVWIASGWFTYGADEDDLEHARRLCVRERARAGLRLHPCASDAAFADELPARRVFLSDFGIDRREVSQAEHSRCTQAGECDPPAFVSEHPGLAAPELPAIGLTHAQAEALCRFRGGRLPTEAEWEGAVRGDSARRFPWGSFYNPGLANHGAPASAVDIQVGDGAEEDGFAHLAPIWAFATARGPHGLVQAAGNAWEWTADSFAGVRAQPPGVDPVVALDNGERVVRGGSFRSPALALRVTHREARAERQAYPDVGVRCAYSLRSGSGAQKPP
ncbi:MAG TPA: SUMF1/EgtB/PvdO family nonheme iron enzyme [Polyangiales bacterium]|nr:SUMF1/EgtB/PvdO family nonheme iron enzyme [Polyangiales bacterium]